MDMFSYEQWENFPLYFISKKLMKQSKSICMKVENKSLLASPHQKIHTHKKMPLR